MPLSHLHGSSITLDVCKEALPLGLCHMSSAARILYYAKRLLFGQVMDQIVLRNEKPSDTPKPWSRRGAHLHLVYS